MLLLGGAAWLTVRALATPRGRNPVAIAALLLPGLLLGWFEYENHAADARLSRAASALAGRPVHVSCQRLLATLLDASANRGEVEFDARGKPGDETLLKYETCQALYDYLGSDKHAPDLDQVIAVHILAHEAAHLAGERSEALAECQSVQSDERGGPAFSARRRTRPGRWRSTTPSTSTRACRTTTAAPTAATAAPSTSTPTPTAGHDPPASTACRSTAPPVGTRSPTGRLTPCHVATVG